MAEILIRDPHHFYWVTDPQILHRIRKKREIQRDLIQTLKRLGREDKQLAYLRAVKRREMLLIGVGFASDRDSRGNAVCSFRSCRGTDLCHVRHLRDGETHSQSSAEGLFRFTIFAMGKLGGGELNFSSDVDLMFLYASNDEKAPGISAQEYFRRSRSESQRG